MVGEPGGRDAADTLRSRTVSPWPSGVRHTARHHTLVHLTGDFDNTSLQVIQELFPWRYVTRCESEIVVWPLGTTWVSHHPAATVLRGRFDVRDLEAVQAAHPGRAVSHDGDLITVWPLLPTGTGRQASPEEEAR
ncbi:hypothetical protein OG782_01065 [Streptomyces sp. NBC_00876]|uniref:hypothetical protein n=1 Tax=Streptomyces sp. NBC_00876 TaxID=2975853 RepID=UPI0038643153|nr:hypothetical protein OG782_01065 [Streptomyces sp. NBC_00876]